MTSFGVMRPKLIAKVMIMAVMPPRHYLGTQSERAAKLLRPQPWFALWLAH
jgi:hypothetical protein